MRVRVARCGDVHAGALAFASASLCMCTYIYIYIYLITYIYYLFYAFACRLTELVAKEERKHAVLSQMLVSLRQGAGQNIMSLSQDIKLEGRATPDTSGPTSAVLADSSSQHLQFMHYGLKE